jgi:hypothetical protein
MENQQQDFVSFGLGHTPLAYWLMSVMAAFGLVWGAAAATDRRAAAVKSLTSEMRQLAQRRLALRNRGQSDE